MSDERRGVKVEVLHEDLWGGACHTMTGWREWLEEMFSRVPEEHREQATLEIESEGGYDGSHNAAVTVYYWREESDDEQRSRQTREHRALIEQERLLAERLEAIQARLRKEE